MEPVGTLSPTSERKPFGRLSPISEDNDTGCGSTVTMPIQPPSDYLREPPIIHTNTSWLHNFLINTHLAAPSRRMGAGLGFYGVATMPRNGVVDYGTYHEKGDDAV